MKYSESYMRFMAAGELAVLLIGLTLCVAAFVVVPHSSVIVKVMAGFVGFVLPVKVLLAFVHSGYEPSDEPE